MYPLAHSEILNELKKCRLCSTDFPITNTDIKFYEKVSPTFGGKKYLIPSPNLCPDCRQKRRLAFHNERKLYRRICNVTKKEIISIYPPNTTFPIYHQDYWWSDSWNPLDYGKDFDFSLSFFQQWASISENFPRQALIAKDCENSEYVNFVWKVKDSYLISAASFDEHCYYGNRVTKSKDCVDTFLVKESESCYESVDVNNSYGCVFSERLSFCRDCEFCSDCEGCNDCMLSINLHNKSYYIQNVAYEKDEFFEKKRELQQLGVTRLLELKKQFFSHSPRKESHILSSENALGNALRNAKDVTCVYDGDQLHGVKYSAFVDDVKDAYDINYGYGETTLQYESLGTGEKSYSVLFCLNVWPNISYMIYCDTCTGCHHCFGCIGLRHKQYCILNKQYSKEEYEELVPRIIEKMMGDGEWGEFFPVTLSPFGYNETVASEYYPLTKEEALKQGFNWSDYEAPFPKVAKVIPARKLPESIESIPDDILNWAIECEVSKKPYRIIRQELEFYRKHNLPIPKRHPDVRHMDRMRLRNPRKLFERKCDSCEKLIITTYAPERPETVYCKECYENKVIN